MARKGDLVAKNDQQKGRSLEEQLASLDALSNERDEPPAGEPAAAEQPPNGEPAVPPNPWLNRSEPPAGEAWEPPPAAGTPASDVTAPVPTIPDPAPAPGPAPAPPPPAEGGPGLGAAPPEPPPPPPLPDFPGPPPFSPHGFSAYGPPPGPFGPAEPPPPPAPAPPDDPPYPTVPPPSIGGPQPYAEQQPHAGPPAYQGPPPYQQVQHQPYPPRQQPGYPPGQQSALPMPPANLAPPQQATRQAPPQAPGWDSLSSENLLRDRRQAPSGGWRRLVYKATAGTVHPGESPAELRRRELIARACTPVAGGHHRVAVMSLKGGVGKTTTTVGLGATLASLRGDRVIAVDANPDRGTLSDKVRLETRATVRDLVNERDQIGRYADVRAYTSQSSSRLEVLASDQDPAVSEAFSEQDYRTVTQVLEHYYSICLTDCGTGLLHSAMAGVLSLADQLVLVSSPSVDGARSASATLDWLQAHGHGALVQGGVVVLSMVRPRSKSTVDLDRLQEHFEARCRAVVRIPYDAHLEEGAEVELDQLAQATRDAYLELAAMVGDGFAYRH
jgi:MinD-like ATPase involved in chromosome partitioning or flagellar assembly